MYSLTSVASVLVLQNAIEKPPLFLPSWTGVYLLNFAIVMWTVVIGIGWGGWASVTNFAQQVYTFGVFAPCYQCPPKQPVNHHT